MFQSKLAMIVLIDNIILLSNVRPDLQPHNIKNQIKAITVRHLDIKKYMDTVVNSHHLLYTTYLISGLIGGLLSIAEYFAVIFANCLNI